MIEGALLTAEVEELIPVGSDTTFHRRLNKTASRPANFRVAELTVVNGGETVSLIGATDSERQFTRNA